MRIIRADNFQNIVEGYLALKGTAKRRRHRTAELDIPLTRDRHHLGKIRNRLIDRLVQVGLAMAFAR